MCTVDRTQPSPDALLTDPFLGVVFQHLASSVPDLRGDEVSVHWLRWRSTCVWVCGGGWVVRGSYINVISSQDVG